MLIPNAPAVGEMSEGLSTVPEGVYSLRIHKAEYVATPKSATAKGPYVKTQIIITGGGPVDAQGAPTEDHEKFKGRYVFQNYSMTGDGSFRLRELLQVTGHPEDFKLTDDQQLVGLEFRGSVVIQPGTGGYPEKNQVGKHFPLV